MLASITACKDKPALFFGCGLMLCLSSRLPRKSSWQQNGRYIYFFASLNTVEPRFNEVTGDWSNLFVKSRVRYIENLDIRNLRGNNQNVRYIEVIVNDWFVTQMTSVTQFNAIFFTQKWRVLRCNSLSMVAFSSNYFHFWADEQLLFTKERHFQSWFKSAATWRLYREWRS